MSEIKYKVSIINSKWETVKRNIILPILPRKDEYLFFNEKYHLVVNLVHRLEEEHEIFIIIEDLENKNSITEKKD